MQSLLEFSANKSCPQLSRDYVLLSDSLPENIQLSNNVHASHPYQLLSESDLKSRSHEPYHVAMTTTQDDAIEILSCQVEQDDDDIEDRCAIVQIKLANGESLNEGPASVHRKRVVRAVGAVTFLLLLFSIILIGISLNMSKEIDEMVRQSNTAMRNPQSNFVTRKDNLTQLA